jgi:hypothetical protein
MSPVAKSIPTEAEEQVIERLDLILNVLALQFALTVGEGQSNTERVRLLKLAGLDNNTIARVLNTTPNVVRALASNLKSGRKATRR